MTQEQGGRSAVRIAFILTAIVVVALLLWQLRTLLLLMFGGVLVAMLLGMPANWLSARCGLARRYTYPLAVFLVGSVVVLAVGFAGWRMSGEFEQLGATAANGISKLQALLPDWAQTELQQMRSSGLSSFVGEWFGRVAGAAGFFLTGVANFVLVFFIGIFFGASPETYRDGFVALFPQQRQERLRHVLNSCADALRRWLQGQFLSMLVIGLMTTGGLLLLGVPMALPLGILAGLLEFIPIIGPLAAAVPAVLIALTVDPVFAVWVTLLYIGIQQIESNVLMPLINRWAVSMPPAVALVAGVAFVFVFGWVGAFFAVPLALVVMILIGKLYVEDVLDQTYKGPGSGKRN